MPGLSSLHAVITKLFHSSCLLKHTEKFTAENFFFIFLNKNCNYLTLGLHKGSQSYRRSLQPSKENIQSSTSKHEISYLFSILVVNFCPPGSGSGFRIRIRITNLVKSGFGSETLEKCVYPVEPILFRSSAVTLSTDLFRLMPFLCQFIGIRTQIL